MASVQTMTQIHEEKVILSLILVEVIKDTTSVLECIQVSLNSVARVVIDDIGCRFSTCRAR